MTALGIILFCSAVFVIWRRYRNADRPFRFPLYGHIGAAILVGGHGLTMAGNVPVATYFTAIAWTGYILWADAAVFSLKGKSLLRTFPAEFAGIAVLSIPLWLIFEAYNLRLANWIYVGLPSNMLARVVGYAWAFATIWPGIFETAALLGALGLAGNPSPDRKAAAAEFQPSDPQQDSQANGAISHLSILAGAILLIAPLLMPAYLRPYLFGAIWLGFIFLLEPINRRTGAESLWRDVERGDHSLLLALLLAGAVCGIFWEFWNHLALARWVYVFPIFQDYRIFAMPLPGYLGFPPFALECFAMLAFVVRIANAATGRLGIGSTFRREALEL